MSGKSPKKTARVADHPTYHCMIASAISSLKERRGSSRQAILKYVSANYKVTERCNLHLNRALKKGVADSSITKVKGSYKLAVAVKAKKAIKPKTPKKKTPKKVAKKTAKPKKAPAKKTKKATPKKAKKPVAKKVKKSATKKPAPKKARAKKVTKPKTKKAK